MIDPLWLVLIIPFTIFFTQIGVNVAWLVIKKKFINKS